MNSVITQRGFFYLKNTLKRLSTASVQAITKVEFANRRANFVKKIAAFKPSEPCNSSRHLALIPANELLYQSLHVPCHPFRQDSYFRYLTGIIEPGAVLAIEISSINMPSSFDDSVAFVPRLFVEERNAHDRLWDGPTMGVTAISEATGIQDTMSLDLLPEYLSSALPQLTNTAADCIWFGPPFAMRKKVKAPINKTILKLIYEKFTECAIDQKQMQDPTVLLDELRLIKSPAEVALMRRAVNITSTALKKTMHFAFPGIREAELAARIEFEVRMMGGRLGYPAVVAGGPRANIIHYLANEGVIEDGQLVLMDVGAEIEGYTADISRTWPINGSFNKEQRILHEILVQVQRDCQQAAGPDNHLEGVYEVMLKQLAKYLVEEKVLRESEISKQAHHVCPHHVGHYLGLDVHDTASVSYNQALVPGTVFPLEPGIYFPEAGCDLFNIPPQFRGLGLRLEDDFVISPEGRAEHLDKTLSSDASNLEACIGRSDLSQAARERTAST